MGSEGIEAPAASRRFGTSFAGGWGGTLLAGVVLLVLAGALAWLGLTGRLADLRHANLPFHPYPPSGYALNPFNPGNPDDLINVADANKVRADFSQRSAMESDAPLHAQTRPPWPVDRWQFPGEASTPIGSNQAAGHPREERSPRLNRSCRPPHGPQRPRRPMVRGGEGLWSCDYVKSSTGEVLRSQRLQFKSKYWLRRGADGRYLIADSLVRLE